MRIKTLLTSALFAKEGEQFAPVALPHTWNALDGQDGGADYWRGIGTYKIDLPNPSKMLLQGRPENAPGSCVACVMEGSRPVLAEIQALVTKTSFNVPRRAADGFDFNRAVLMMAVAEKRGGLNLSTFDAYINVVGGLRLDEPAADLPLILAVASVYRDRPIPATLAAIGEVGLTGEIRAVNHLSQRLQEVSRLGFKQCVIPRYGSDKVEIPEGLEVFRVRNIREAIEFAL